jgi:hypothetical protein
MKKTSLDAYFEFESIHDDKHVKRIYDCIKYRTNSTYTEIVYWTGITLPTVVGRINDLLYRWQRIKVTGEKGGKSTYSIRNSGEPLNIRPQSLHEQLLSKIEKLIENNNGQMFIGIDEVKKLII